VYLATASVGWFPRRYRGHDNVWWRNEMGFFEKTVDTLASPKDRMATVPIQTGRCGGHDISLRTLAAMGVRLAGRLAAASGTRVRFADDLETNLARSDEVAHRLIAEIDDFIRARGIGAPPDLLDRSASSRSMPGITELDLEKARVGSVVWATGYEFDWGWVELPAFDEYAYPIQRQGVTSWPGLYFVGLHWMHTRGSGLIWGVGRDAEHIASHIAATRP
jgi:putative flavoprotein involved in K+ transport